MKTAAELKCGEKVKAFNDPLEFSVRGTLIALRKKEADCIIVS